MANEIETLLTEYEKKRRDNRVDLENRKKALFNKIPRLEEIDDEINNFYKQN